MRTNEIGTFVFQTYEFKMGESKLGETGLLVFLLFYVVGIFFVVINAVDR